MTLRNLQPDDYDYVIERVDDWWGGRPIRALLSKLFFVHFTDTSFVATHDDQLAGFLCGFLSQSQPDQAYIHFVGVDPDTRAQGVGRALYERFFDVARDTGRTRVGCVTSPVNERSIAFHEAMGFTGTTVADYDGPGEDRVVFARHL